MTGQCSFTTHSIQDTQLPPPQTLWTYTTGDIVDSSPAVAYGNVYVGSNDAKVYCLDAATGALVWNYTTGVAIWGSPAIADSKVYIGSFDKKFYCLNALTGALVWNFTTGGNVYSAPAVVDGNVYVGSDDSKVYCFNAANGALVWNYTTRGGVGSSPAVVDGNVYVGSKDFSFYCLNAANGALVWNYTTGGGASSSPAVGDDRVYVASRDKTVYCLDAATGASIWNYTTGAMIWTSSPALAGGKVYVGSGDRKVYCLNAANGALVWNYTTGGPVYGSSPAVADGKVYVGSYDNGKVYCLDAATGALIWNYRTDTPPGSWGVWSSPAVANGVVYVGSEDKSIYAFGATARFDWSLVTEGRALKAYPDLREYVWQKNASRAPNGPYDKIGLHRLVKTGITPKGVVFMLPGLYSSGEKLVSNPATDSFTKTENDSNCIYWANKGFDVYTIDYRNHFIPMNFNKSQLSFTADWGIDQFMSDIKEAVDKTKEISGAQKVFMSGISWGGILAQFYAAKYWQQDLRGLVLLDPGPVKSTVAKNQNLTNSYNLTTTVNTMKTAGGWLWENPQQSNTPSSLNPGYIFLIQFAAQNPGAPAQYLNGTLVTTINPRTNKTWTNITEWIEYQYNPSSSNTYGGYSNITVNMNLAAQGERYYPVRVFLDYAAMLDWTVCPYLPYDYFAHVNEINVPVLAFRSGLNLAAFGNITNGMATKDFTWTVLPNYGHNDVFQGTYSARDVSQPALDWMRGQLVGLKATAFCSVTVLPGWTWWFFAHSNGGTGSHTYQWYEGTTMLQGQTAMVLPVTKTLPGTCTYYCKVTDSEGATAYSNTVTLTVLG